MLEISWTTWSEKRRVIHENGIRRKCPFERTFSFVGVRGPRDQPESVVGDHIGKVGTITWGHDFIVEGVAGENRERVGEPLQEGGIVGGELIEISLGDLEAGRLAPGGELPIEVTMFLNMRKFLSTVLLGSILHGEPPRNIHGKPNAGIKRGVLQTGKGTYEWGQPIQSSGSG